MTRTTLSLVAVGLIALVATGGFAVANSAGTNDDGLSAIRNATAKYHDVDRALADGYVVASPCVASPLGGMGHHVVNFALVADPAIDPVQPEALLYAPGPNGKLRLAGVEYVAVDADQNVNTDDDRPTVHGQPFQGPMEGHGPNEPVHYDLHVWVWTHNPNGMFNPWNPRITC